MKYGIIILFVLLHLTYSKDDEDLYKLLGVAKDATVRDIRKAFKNFALKYHPDKNKKDEESEAKFIKAAKAYEILKNPDTRNRYDLYGEKFDKTSTTYQNYNYYKDYFGLYDDDPLIITLSRSDYDINVLDDNQAWFIDFYAPHCHHCQHLAPIWRKLAQQLEGVIKIAAVNCEEDMGLCYQLDIDSYPTLLYYEKQSHIYEGEYYRGPRTLENLEDFVLSKLNVNVQTITPNEWNSEEFNKKRWLLFLCGGNSVCPEEKTQIKLSASLDGLVAVGIVTDEKLCETISSSYIGSPILFWQNKTHIIRGSDTKEILDAVLELLPNPNQITDEDFRNIRENLKAGEEKPWLLCFFMGAAAELSLQLKRLPIYLPNINLGLIHCGRYAALCTSLHVSHYPAWGILKKGGAFELHHGRNILNEVITFAKDGIKSTNFHILSPTDLEDILQSGKPWFIDWYAPWCPPCRKLMPEVRKASQQFAPDFVQFGAVDCTVYQQLCIKHSIRSYPTTMVYNGSKTYHFHGVPNDKGISDFIKDVLNSVVIPLDSKSFASLNEKSATEMWIVNFHAPWCGPCQRLADQWRTLANQLLVFKQVKVADVDCVANSDLCTYQNIRSYPTIRMYPIGSKGLNTVIMYNGHRDAFSMKKWITGFLPSSEVNHHDEL